MTRRASPGHQRGVTLVELMVGLTLGMTLAVALLLLFANASSSGREIARTGEQIENGRYASDLLAEELRMAGFYGELSMAGASFENPDPCSTAPGGWVRTPLTMPAPIQGFGATDAVACLPDRLPGTHALAVRRLSVNAVAPSTLVSGTGRHFVQYSFCVDDAVNLPFVFSATLTDFTLRNRACSAPNLMREYISRIYYVASCNRCGSSGGDNDPTLKRVELFGNTLRTVALVDGIEALRFEYGFDTDGDGSADEYRLAPDVSGPASLWSNVMSVKVHFLSRSLERTSAGLATGQTLRLGATGTVQTTADGFTRRAYSVVVRLINPSGARELQ